MTQLLMDKEAEINFVLEKQRQIDISIGEIMEFRTHQEQLSTDLLSKVDRIEKVLSVPMILPPLFAFTFVSAACAGSSSTMHKHD